MTAASSVTDAQVADFRSAVERVLAARADGPICFEDPVATQAALWETACDLGWPLIGLDEAHGGAGGGLPELAVLAEGVGRWLAPGPFIGTAIGVAAASFSPGSAEELASLTRSGFALGISRPESDDVQFFFASDPPELAIHLSVGSITLTSIRSIGLDDPSAAFVPGLLTLRGQTLADASVATLGLGESLGIQIAVARVLLAAQALGICQRMLEVTVEYAKNRTQFGRPIGSFQAVKHRCANMAIAEQATRAVVEFAVDAVAAGSDAGPTAALVAVDVATSSAAAMSEDCLETHGAMGHTWEFGGHRFLKQALVLRAIERGLRRECGDG